MENQLSKPMSLLPPPKHSALRSWLFIAIVLIIGLGAATYLYFNDRLAVEQTSDITVLNTNSAIDTANQANTNESNVNAEIVPDAAVLKTITFQKLDHGFSLQIPENWTGYAYGMGNQEKTDLVIFSYVNPDSSGTGQTETISAQVTFYNNTESLEGWVKAHAQSLRKDNYVISTPVLSTLNGQAVWSIVSTHRSTYDVNGATQTNVSITRSYYWQKGNRAYEMNFYGDEASISRHSAEISVIVGSFTFIDPKPTIALADFAASSKAIAPKEYGLTIDWLASPADLNLTNDPFIGVVGILSRAYEKVGTVTNGAYRGLALLNIYEIDEGPAAGPTLFQAVYNESDKTLVYLIDATNGYQPEGVDFAQDRASTIPELDYPSEISLPNSAVKLAAESYDTVTKFSALSNLEKQFTDGETGDVYIDWTGRCYLIKQADGLVKRYHVKIPFAKAETVNADYPADPTQIMPLITWNDGSANTAEFQSKDYSGGCSTLMHCQNILTDAEVGGISALKITGRTSTGDNVYEYVDTNAASLKSIYDGLYAPQGEQKPAYDDFVARHPIFLWQNPLGHWVSFRNMTYMPAAECGKPVIYLYPTEETQVNVKVQPTGGLTVTDPAYPDDGWTVTAWPDGRLTAADGAYYPYLFWEGIGLNYQMPSRGFVVARRDVGQFLRDKLALLGLTAQESADFIDFWQSKLEVKPYVFVTFIDQAVFDRLAPLTVTPKPDQVIRVFMDYQPLDAPITVEPLPLKTPARHGFTVVEWGGALHR